MTEKQQYFDLLPISLKFNTRNQYPTHLLGFAVGGINV
jgi:hypothetical protein